MKAARPAAPAARPVQVTPAAAYEPSIAAGAFADRDTELQDWKAERRTRLWEALGPWRWVGVAAGAGALALWLTRADPGHLAGVLASISAVAWAAAGRRYRFYLRSRS